MLLAYLLGDSQRHVRVLRSPRFAFRLCSRIVSLAHRMDEVGETAQRNADLGVSTYGLE